MKKFLITVVLLSAFCMYTGCAGSAENSSRPVSDDKVSLPKTSISDSTATQPHEEYEALVEESLRVITIEDNVVTDCSSFASGIVIIPEGVTTIGIEAFEGCDSITEIRVPSSVELIANYAFKDCSALETLDISEGLLAIYGSVFDGCTALKKVALPDSLAVVSEYIFADIDVTFTYKGQSYTSADAQALCEAVEHYDENGFLVADGKLFTVLPSVGGDVVIPNTVEKICEGAFFGNDIDMLYIPGSVKEIEGFAFVECGLISEVTLNEGITKIGDNAFIASPGYDYAVKLIHIPSSLTDISEYSLYDCNVCEYNGVEYRWYGRYEFGENHLYMLYGMLIENGVLKDFLYCRDSYYEPLVIPEGVTAIGEAAFSDTPVFFELQLPQTLTEISDKALYSTYIRNVEIPSGVKRIGDSAFYGCFNLETVKLSEGLEEIGGKSFAGCDDLAEINIPSTVKFIDETAFENSDNITVTYNGSSYTQDNISELFAAVNG